jgi:hypothetical protein
LIDYGAKSAGFLNRIGSLLNRFEPRLLPKDQARCLATPICSAVAAEFKVHRAVNLSASDGIDRVTGLVRALEDPETLAAIFEHLGHEWEPVQAALVVERPEDLILGPHFHPIASS